MTLTGTALRTKDERDSLIEQYLPLVHHIVGRMGLALPPGIEKEDLYSAGVLGLMHAAESYDPTKGAIFKTYAYTIVRGAILDELRRQDPVPRGMRERIRKLDKAFGELSARLGRLPSRGELGEHLGCTIEEIDQDLVSSHTAQVLSLNDFAEESDSRNTWIPGDLSSQPESTAEKKDLIERMAIEIGRLPEQCCQVIVLYYNEGLLLKEIGQILGISESRVCQILSKAMSLLRLAMREVN
ncbi:MAG: sigma-70 family RNA polymerase sigma factor [Planctomycetota bacterium]